MVFRKRNMFVCACGCLCARACVYEWINSFHLLGRSFERCGTYKSP